MRFEIFLILILFEVTEHRTIIHVVTEDNVIRIAEIASIVRHKINSTGNARIAEDVLGSIFQVILALNYRVIDISIVDRKPAPGILIDFLESCKAVLIVVGAASVTVALAGVIIYFYRHRLILLELIG